MSVEERYTYEEANYLALARLAALTFMHSDQVPAGEYGVEDTDSGTLKVQPDKAIWADHLRVLDFASGPGLISKYVAPHVGEVLGLDISEKMVEMYNSYMEELGIKNAKSLCVDITKGDTKLEPFDIALCSMSYHHLDDMTDMTRQIVDQLKPGGWFFMLDHQGSDTLLKPKENMSNDELIHRVGFATEKFSEGFYKHLKNVHVRTDLRFRMWFPEEKLLPWEDVEDKDKLESRVDSEGQRIYKIVRNLIVVYGQKA